ncbi:glycoside hydrolase family protein [Roseomonas marmotae]|uniref:glycoside hydrolase family protein n=1 Tax=Roseomonas marmotae TaxID=2768161 RepID=UPI003AF4F1E3
MTSAPAPSPAQPRYASSRRGTDRARPQALQLWNKAGGKVLKGLQRRRRAESLVMLGAAAESAIAAAARDFP